MSTTRNKRNRAYLVYFGEFLDAAVAYRTQAAAREAYRIAATAEVRSGVVDTATSAYIHLAPSRDEMVDYPDVYLTLSPRGAVRVEKAL